MCSQVRKIFAHLDINKIARSSNFVKRKPRKIHPEDFLTSFMICFSKTNFSFRQWACHLSYYIKQNVSFQILSKRCSKDCLHFVKSVLDKAICNQIKSGAESSKISKYFSRILIEDSTCFQLGKRVIEHYSGAGNGKSKSAMLKTHYCYDLLTMNTLSYNLTKINVNDVSQNRNIMAHVKANDLVLRDLGYLSFKALQEIDEKEAFYISRLKHDFKYFSVEDESEFDLIKALKKVEKSGQNTFVKKLKIGRQKKLAASLIAVKLTQEQVDQRFKKYNCKKLKKHKTSQTKKYLIKWSIFVTNIENEQIEIEQIFKLYSLRWQIELLFKTWKSRFGIDSILKKYTGNDPIKIQILFHLSLLFCLSVFRPLYVKYENLMNLKFKRNLSMQKFATMIINHLDKLFIGSELTQRMVMTLACFGKRKDRIDYKQVINNF